MRRRKARGTVRIGRKGTPAAERRKGKRNRKVHRRRTAATRSRRQRRRRRRQRRRRRRHPPRRLRGRMDEQVELIQEPAHRRRRRDPWLTGRRKKGKKIQRIAATKLIR
jgi:hypothetical protein